MSPREAEHNTEKDSPLDDSDNGNDCNQNPGRTPSSSNSSTRESAKSTGGTSSMFFSANLYPKTQRATSVNNQGLSERSANNVKDQEIKQEDDDSSTICCQRLCKAWWSIYAQYEFLILIIVAICLARAYPPLGAEYLQPQITSTWIAVVLIFSKWYIQYNDQVFCYRRVSF